MKKSERINDMILFLNNSRVFNLKDIMAKYEISKSTALRDIQSLEELGMPIFSDLGRYGKYGILDNSLLSPILFNMDEILTLYFSMQTIKAYQSTPFHIQMEKLDEKFQNCLSPDQKNRIDQMKDIFQFETKDYTNPCDCLNEILNGILNGEISRIVYSRNDSEKEYLVKFFRITARFGQWYANALDMDKDRYLTFRCDLVRSIMRENRDYPLSASEVNQDYMNRNRQDRDIVFEVEVDGRGRDLFFKENYPNMKISTEDKNIIKGSCRTDEMDFVADYFLGFGNSVLSVRPLDLAKLIRERIGLLLSHYSDLLQSEEVAP